MILGAYQRRPKAVFLWGRRRGLVSLDNSRQMDACLICFLY